MAKKNDENAVLGACYVCGMDVIFHQDFVPLGEEKVRHKACAPGSKMWMDSEAGKASPIRDCYLKASEVKATKVKGHVSPQHRVVQMFSARVKYLMYMAKVNTNDMGSMSWTFDMGGISLIAEGQEAVVVVDTVHGPIEVAVMPIDTLTQRILAHGPLIVVS